MPREFAWKYRYTALLAVVIGNFAQFGSRVVLSPLVPDIMRTFSVSKSAIGLALTGMWAAYALLQFPSGVFADRFGERRVLLLAMVLLGSGNLLLSISPSFASFAVVAFFTGAGAGLFLTVGISLVTKLYQNTGQALGFVTVGSGTVGLFGPPAAAFVAVRHGWRVVPTMSAAAAFLTFGFLLFRVRPTTPEASDGSLSALLGPGTMFEFLARPRTLYALALAVIINFTFQSFVSFFPVFLTEYWTVSIETASFAFGAIFFGYTVGQPVMGRVSDRLGRDAVIAADAVAVMTGLVLLLAGSSPVSAAVGVACLAIGFTWFGVVNAKISDIFTPEERGTGVGLVRTAMLLLGSLGSVVTGTLADNAGWPVAYGLVIGLLVVAIGAIAANRALRLGL